jgi:hypothetical protein
LVSGLIILGVDDDEVLFYNADDDNDEDSTSGGSNVREATNFGAGK